MSDALARIEAYKREEIAARKAAAPARDIEARARDVEPPRGFLKALVRDAHAQGLGLIAEIKKASPSKGLIRADFDPPARSRAYEAGGASCLSVLTDGPSFQGDDAYLAAARAATALPCLRKDFLYDPWQVAESRALGADCILVILAAVDDATAAALLDEARRWGMDALVEVHDGAELARALALKAALIGVNNRDLRSFDTRLETFESLSPQAHGDTAAPQLLVAESGVFTHADAMRMKAAGAGAILVGESLMRQADVTAATRALLGR